MADQFSFDQSYLDYYQNRLEHASDGTRIPGMDVIAQLIAKLDIKAGQQVLDVGCSFGRLLPLLSALTDVVYGIELSYDVVDVAARKGYRCVIRGSGEDSNLPSSFFSHLVLFGVFDCCDQTKALRETRRLLVPGGRALITGKNFDYRDDDILALRAESNAWRKSFPNSFTYASRLGDLLPGFGLGLVELLRFERRGDFGEMRHLPNEALPNQPFYEFAAIVEAVDHPAAAPGASAVEVSVPVSTTAERAAKRNAFASAPDFFRSDYLDKAVV